MLKTAQGPDGDILRSVEELEAGRDDKETRRQARDILRALDYFQAVSAPRDPRLAEAIAVVRSSQRDDGRWALEQSHKGKTYFDMERLGAPSRKRSLAPKTR